MKTGFATAMRRALSLTRAGDVAAATRAIQDLLAPGIGDRGQTPQPAPRPEIGLRLADHRDTVVDPSDDASSPAEVHGRVGRHPRMRRPLGDALAILREGRRRVGLAVGLPTGAVPAMRTPVPSLPEGAEFQARSFTGAAGSRPYKFYIPASLADRPPRGLVLMLHGCKQGPDDFAAGTKMNTLAETHGLLVAYPGQVQSANVSSCWNWFNPADQMRDAGEPSIIAGITRAIITEFKLDERRVFVAGLSAGGAMAAVMGAAYPDLYAAVGIHSGLAYGSANDVLSAFAAMRGEAGHGLRPPGARTAEGSQPRMIVFQGAADGTVHLSNAERIVAAASHTEGRRQQNRGSAGGRGYTRTIVDDAGGAPLVEYWLIDGAGHAWSGGDTCGTFTDPQGPDASAEMIRFFLRGA